MENTTDNQQTGEPAEELLDGVPAMNKFAMFDWSKVVGVTSTLKYNQVYLSNGQTVDVQIPWILEGKLDVQLTSQFEKYLEEKNTMQKKLADLQNKINDIELKYQYTPIEGLNNEFNKAKQDFNVLKQLVN